MSLLKSVFSSYNNLLTVQSVYFVPVDSHAELYLWAGTRFKAGLLNKRTVFLSNNIFDPLISPFHSSTLPLNLHSSLPPNLLISLLLHYKRLTMCVSNTNGLKSPVPSSEFVSECEIIVSSSDLAYDITTDLC